MVPIVKYLVVKYICTYDVPPVLYLIVAYVCTYIGGSQRVPEGMYPHIRTSIYIIIHMSNLFA